MDLGNQLLQRYVGTTCRRDRSSSDETKGQFGVTVQPKVHHTSIQPAPFGQSKPGVAAKQVIEDILIELKTEKLIDEYGVRLKSETDEYEICQFLGEGTFGKVVKCLNVRTNEAVAVKIHNAESSKSITFVDECNILRRLNKENPEKFHIVRTLDCFSYNHRGFLVFEMLEKSLEDYMKRPLPLMGVWLIAEQLLTALTKLKKLNIVHTDIKPGNIMLVDQRRQPFRIKLIDFSSAMQMPTAYRTRKLQTRYYRAPEIILDLPYNEKIDVWSAGCSLAELLLGFVLYPGSSEYDMIRLIQETHGVPPWHMLSNNSKAEMFFCEVRISRKNNCSDGENEWRLKTPQEYEAATGTKFRKTRTFMLKSLEHIVQMNADTTHWKPEEKHVREELYVREQCTDLLKRMLEIDQGKRISAEEGLRHRFFSFLKNS